ncbi:MULTISPECIES: hypothetical protein [Salinibaculum]|uniref:hypothetical protein n=1 Tax=Salinibaculum TaxID=2732368 RepID=UPI0030CEC190
MGFLSTVETGPDALECNRDLIGVLDGSNRLGHLVELYDAFVDYSVSNRQG